MSILKEINNKFGAAMFTKQMFNIAELKFGRTKSGAINDVYANELLNFMSYYTSESSGIFGIRMFLKALVARELGMYLLTGESTPFLLAKAKRLDSAFYYNGFLSYCNEGQKALTA